MPAKTVLFTGGSGFIGTRLVPVLLHRGYQLTILSRNPEKTAVKFDHKVKAIKSLEQADWQCGYHVVINLVGQGIADRRWTRRTRSLLRSSRIDITRELVDRIRHARQQPEVFVSGSAIGIYGDRGDIELDESAGQGEGFACRLCRDWEMEARAAAVMGVRTCYLRTGIVLGKDGGALAKMLPVFKLGLGGRMGSGQQWMSWIHINDIVKIIMYLVENPNMQGAINATAPNPVTNISFTASLARVLFRPAIIPVPAFALKLMLGQMAEELLLSGQRVIPRALLESGFQFKFTELESALRDVTGKNQSSI